MPITELLSEILYYTDRKNVLAKSTWIYKATTMLSGANMSLSKTIRPANTGDMTWLFDEKANRLANLLIKRDKKRR